MARNVLILAPSRGPVAHAAELAARSGEEVGLVLTSIDLGREKVSGGRIEEERDYAGITASALDEPVFIGSAIAQLAGHCETVIVDGLERWIERVVERFPDDPIERDAEVLSLLSVMQARMADLLLIARPALPLAAVARELLMRALDLAKKHADEVITLDR
ncbi:MAG: hypothetical protein JNL90_10095 [Planctomycetes bacterium]|nr:hypothetical protein [Planctomycetota bacterium]